MQGVNTCRGLLHISVRCSGKFVMATQICMCVTYYGLPDECVYFCKRLWRKTETLSTRTHYYIQSIYEANARRMIYWIISVIVAGELSQHIPNLWPHRGRGDYNV